MFATQSTSKRYQSRWATSSTNLGDLEIGRGLNQIGVVVRGFVDGVAHYATAMGDPGLNFGAWVEFLSG